MYALTVTRDGYSDRSSGPVVDRLEPYLRAAEIDEPEPGPGQVSIRVRLANVNPSDVHFVKGEYGIPRRAGGVAGFEGCGDVVGAGAGAEALVGARVAFVATAGGSWAESVVCEAASCVPVPAALRDEDAAALIVNPLSAIGLIRTVRDHGCAGIALTAASSQLAKLALSLARDEDLPAVAIARRAETLDELRRLGATHAFDETGDPASVLATAGPTALLDAVVDLRSTHLFARLPAGSRWIVYGKLSEETPPFEAAGSLIFQGKSIEGFWLTTWLARLAPEARRSAFEAAIRRFLDGTWTTDVRRILPLRDALAELPAELGRPNTGKVLLSP